MRRQPRNKLWYKIVPIRLDLSRDWSCDFITLQFFNEFTYKSQVFCLWSKNKLFNIFKFWLLYTKKTYIKNSEYWKINNIKEFINIALKGFYNEKSITIDYATLYMHKKN